jgi:hypothetical protein
MIRMKVFKNVELDMDASGATDEDLVDHHNDALKRNNLYVAIRKINVL